MKTIISVKFRETAGLRQIRDGLIPLALVFNTCSRHNSFAFFEPRNYGRGSKLVRLQEFNKEHRALRRNREDV